MEILKLGSPRGVELIILITTDSEMYGAWSAFPEVWRSSDGSIKDIVCLEGIHVFSGGSPVSIHSKLGLPGSVSIADGDLFLIDMDLDIIRGVVSQLDLMGRFLSDTTTIDNRSAISYNNHLFSGTVFLRHCTSGCWINNVNTSSCNCGHVLLERAMESPGHIFQYRGRNALKHFNNMILTLRQIRDGCL